MNIEVLRVFTDDSGAHGNPLGVVRDSASIDNVAAQELAAKLGFAETIFIDEPESGALRIYTPAARLPFAGHPTVGAAWYLHQAGAGLSALVTDAGLVEFEASLAGATVRAHSDMCPEWEFVQLDSAAEVDAAEAGDQPAQKFVWAWLDEAEGSVRARCFATDLGIVEDEATGSAAIRLAEKLGRRLVIQQGAGSVLTAEPVEARVSLSGRVVADQQLTAEAVARVA